MTEFITDPRYSWTIYYIVIAIHVIFVVLVLLGFFEKRKQGKYRFLVRRFLVTAFCIFALDIANGFIPFYLERLLVIGASNVAEVAVLKNRARNEYVLANLNVMFPQTLTVASKLCYQAAASNYVEDQWDQSFRDRNCAKDSPICAKEVDKQEGYYEGARQRVNPKHLVSLDYATLDHVLGSVWVTAAEVYKTIRRLFGEPTNGKMPEPPDEKMLASYHSYFANCSAFKPLPWAKMGDEIVKSPADLCIGTCP